MEFAAAKEFILAKLKKELPRSLTYHSVRHMKDVFRAAKRLAHMEGVKGDDLTLLLTAALFHDSGFLWQQHEHETVSCEIAREYLPGYGYTTEQVDQICSMIMATKIPQSPKNKLEEIICDADLDYLGRDDFFKIGDGLFAELKMYGMLSDENEWNAMQEQFLDKHNYFTQSAKKLRQQKKEEFARQVKEKLSSRGVQQMP